MRKINKLLALLLALVLVLQMCPVLSLAAEAEGASVAALPVSDPQSIVWDYTDVFTGSGASGAMDVYRDATYLYIGLRYQNANTLTLTIDGKEFVYALDTSAQTAVVRVPLGANGVAFPGYDKAVALQAVLGGNAGSAVLNGQLYFCAASQEVIASMPASHFKNLVGMTAVDQEGSTVVSLDANAAAGDSFYADTGWYTNVYNNALAAKDQRTQDILVEQTITIEALPASTAATVASYDKIQGLRLAIRDSGASNQEMWLSIHADENGALSAVLANQQILSLGKKVGDTFQLGLQWNVDGTVKVFVDYVQVAVIEKAAALASWAITGDAVTYGYANLAGQVKVNVTDAVVKAPLTAVSLESEINQTVIDSMLSGLNPNLNKNAVASSLALPTSYTSSYVGGVPIHWVSSNTAVVSNNGVVKLPTADTNVTLTAYVGAQQVAVVKLTVKKAELVLTNPSLGAQRTSDITKEAGYGALTFKSLEGSPYGTMDAFWDDSNLYLLVSYQNAAKLDVVVGTYTKSVTLSAASGKEVVTLPLALLGVTVTGLNQYVNLQATLTDASGNAARIAQSAAKVYFAANSAVLQSVNVYSVTDMTHSGGTVTVDKTFSADQQAYMQSSVLGVFNGDGALRDQNLLLEQTVCITALPVAEPGAVTDFVSTRGLYFAMCDKTTVPARADYILQGVFFADGDGKLSLVIGKSTTVIDLGKKLGDTFKLGVQWNINDSVDVYVDNAYICTISSGVYVENYMAAGNSMGITVRNVEGPVKASFSQLVVKAGLPKAMAELVNQSVVEQQVTALNPEADWNMLYDSITLPEFVQTEALGKLPITWTSSNPEVITADGQVTRPKDQTTVTLTAKLAGTTVASLKVTVSNEADGDESGPHIPAYKTSLIYFESFTYPASFIPAGNITGGLDARWNSSTLYLSIKYANATSAKITIGDYTTTVSLSGSSGTKRVDLKFNTLGIQVLYSNQVVPVQVELSNSTHTAYLAKDTASVYLTVKPSTKLYTFSKLLNTGSYNWDTSTSNKYILDTSYTITNTQQTDAALLGKSDSKNVNHVANNLHLQQTIKIESLPVEEFSYNGTASNGLLIYMVDRYDIDGDGVLDGQYTYGILASIRNAGSGDLRLHIADKAQFRLNRKVGDTFTLGMQWNTDDTLDIYVDGVYIGSVEQATLNMPFSGADNVTYSYRDLNDDVRITLSDIFIYKGIPAANAGKLTQQGLENLFAQSNPNVELGAVVADLKLPESYNGLEDEPQAITWVSSNPNVVGNDGKIYPQESNFVVALNAYVGGELAGKITVTVVGSNRMTNAQIHAGYITELTLDGAISEDSWVLNSAVMENGVAVLDMGAQWNTANLYLALQTKILSQVALKVNGVSIDLTGAMAVTSGNTTELAIPMTALGLTVKNYGEEVPVEVTVNGHTYNLTLVLAGVSWFATDNSAHRINSEFLNSTDLGDHGAVKTDDGYYIYDHFGATNVPYSSTTVYYNFPKEDPTKPAVTPLWPVNQTYYLQFDFQATAMPVYDASVTGYNIRNSNCGVSWAVMGERDKDKQDAMADVTLFGIYNNGNNLVFVISGEDALVSFPLDKKVGDLFRIAVAVDADGNLQVFIDGKLVRSVANAEKRLSGMAPYANKGTVAFRVVRDGNVAKSGADNFDVYMSDLSFGLYYGESVLDSLGFDNIKGKNTDQLALIYNLSLPATYTDSRLNNALALTWVSSDPVVISNTGVVTRPSKTGQQVTLTAVTEDGDQKQIQVYVKGKNPGNTVMTIVNDLAPGSSYGKVTDVHEFTLDQNNSSIVFNQGTAKTFNVVRLADGDEVSRLHKDLLKLYVSDNNANYTRIEDFKLLHIGRYWYLYGFEATGRYVKVHCTHFNGSEADFTGPLAEMITAYYEADFGAGEAGFEKTLTYTLSNAGAEKTDYPWMIAAAELGDVFQAENKADARFYLDGELLYHYYENGAFFVRVPYVAAGGSVTLTVKAGNAAAMDISNKEAVYEIVYGSREVTVINKVTGNRIARTLTMSDGRIMGMDVDVSGHGVAVQYSSDGGYSWTTLEKIPESVDVANGVSGFIYDEKLDRIIIVAYVYTDTGTATNFLYTDDCGASWHYLGGTTFDGSGYVDGICLLDSDGAGPNVDYVVGVGAPLVDEQGATLGLQAFSIYSADGGKTWYRSEALTVEAKSGTENGISENSIYQMADGTLVMYARWQDTGIYHFAVYYSYNNGLSWTSEPVFSDVYTVNTNPVLLDDEGNALLVWSGNTALGGDSYRRTPLNIAVSKDQSGLLRFENIQDLYAKYSLQSLDTATQNQATNPHFQIHGDKIIACWMNNFTAVVQLHLDDYRDFLYKTKGAYDDFEGRTVEYEGWASVYGNALRSEAQAYAGGYAMKLEAGSVVVRSVPSVSKGQLSMQVYVPDDSASFVLELQTAFSNDAKASPVKLAVENATLGDVKLHTGWNSLVFDLALDDGKAAVTVNGQATQVSVDTEIADYICYVYLRTGNTTDIYVDEFTLWDRDEEIVYAAEFKGVQYKDLQSALTDAAADGEGTVTLLSDVTTEALTVALGVNLDLNGKTLTVNSMVSYGNVYDNADGVAVLKGGDLLLAHNNSQLPLYDSELGGYRFFQYRMHNYGIKEKAEQVIFGFAPEFDNAAAYALLERGDSGLEVRVKLRCMGVDETYSFDSRLLCKYAQLLEAYPGAGAAMMLRVSGAAELEAGQTMTVTPAVVTGIGVALSGTVMTYNAE